MKISAINQAALTAVATMARQPLASTLRLHPGAVETIRQSEDNFSLPLTIGIGQYGRQLAYQLDSTVYPEFPALIYADTAIDQDPVKNAQEHVLQSLAPETFSAVLMFSLDETDAWPTALSWAYWLRNQDIYLSAAVISTQNIEAALAHPLVTLLRAQLDTVIFHRGDDLGRLPLKFHPMLQSARVFCVEPGLVCYGAEEIKKVLKGRLAIATSCTILPSALGGKPESAYAACVEQLQGLSPDRVFGRWYGGPSMSLSDAHDNEYLLAECLADGGIYGLATGIDPNLPDDSPLLLHTLWGLSES